jgi:ankyrin repeat protein
MKNEK